MRFNKLEILSNKGSGGQGRRQIAAVVLTLLLAGCGLDDTVSNWLSGTDEKARTTQYALFQGAVVADEPVAALVGRKILIEGGNAADAAAAVYFALAVTLPSSASLGGGGVCLVHDTLHRTDESLEFLPRKPQGGDAAGAPAGAVPGNARGFFALQAKYGELRWTQIVAPAEKLARFGINVSRALAHQLARAGPAVTGDADFRRIFGRPDGDGLMREGDLLVQTDLANVLSALRMSGAARLYDGPLARRLADGATRAGVALTYADLAGYHPAWGPTIAVLGEDVTVHFTPPPAVGGAVAATMWSMLTKDQRYLNAPSSERPHMIAEAAMRAYADRTRWLRDDGTVAIGLDELASGSRLKALMASYRSDRHVPVADAYAGPGEPLENPVATGFVVVDYLGRAVACTLTMNALFGTGRVVPGMGIVLAAPPTAAQGGAASIGPVIATGNKSPEVYFAAAATGGDAAPTALINVAVRLFANGLSLDDALAAPRLHHGAAPQPVYYEKEMSDRVLKSLAERGHQLAVAKRLGLVNAVLCREGLPVSPESCSAKADPRGYGLAAIVD